MVEWKRLGEVVSYYRGVTYNKKQEVSLNSGGTKILRANNITVETNTLNFDDVKEISSSVKIKEHQWLYPNDILICAGSGSKEHVGKVAYIYKTINYAFGGFMGKLVTSEGLIPRYFFHVISSSLFKKFLDVALNATTINNLNAGLLNDFLIPIPSLSEQNRIVGILDTFTNSIENLKQQIAQRRKQYEFYRDQLLDLEGKEGVEMKCITDIAQNYTGLTYKPENVSEKGTLVLRSSNIEEDKLAFKDNVFVQMDTIPQRAIAKQGDILICVRNGSKRLVGKAAMITKEAEGMAFGAFMTVLRTTTINSKYLFYLWQSEKVNKQYKGDEAMPIAQITSKDFKRIIVPIISLEEQSRIVSILDTFEASISNLEAQLAQRLKQYEYYRNKLLTFE